MIREFCDRIRDRKGEIVEIYHSELDKEYRMCDYKRLFTLIPRVLPELQEIVIVGDEDYQGTMLMVFIDRINIVYHVSTVDYGSCSGCDALQACRSGEDAWTLLMHICQKMILVD